MLPRRLLVTGIAAVMALAASALTVLWLIRSSHHPDRPPLYAVVAFLFALSAAVTGLVLAVRTARTLARASHKAP